MQSKEVLSATIEALENLKAFNIDTFEVSELTSITDYMVIASGRSNRQVNAIAENVVTEMKQLGLQPVGVEGQSNGDWVLVDLGDVIVHVMHPETRDYYQLEKLWGGENLGTVAETE